MQRSFRLIAAIALATASIAASAQTAMRVRGTITAIDATTIAVKSRTGEDLKLTLADNLAVAVATAAKFEDIKPGDYVGSAAMKGPDGKLTAMEVHYLAPNVPGGHTAWDLAPGATMTNANVAEALVGATGTRELTLKYKDGEQKIVVPANAPIVRAIAGARSDLKVGETVFIAAQSAADGRLTAQRIQVSRDGVKPPQ